MLKAYSSTTSAAAQLPNPATGIFWQSGVSILGFLLMVILLA
jgi:hypothetical protein